MAQGPLFGQDAYLSDLTPIQRNAAEAMMEQASMRDINDMLLMAGHAINQLNKVIGGIGSDDFSINFDPQTGRSIWQLNENIQEQLDTFLPSIGWADRFKALTVQVVDEGDQTVAWGVDYLRSVAATIP